MKLNLSPLAFALSLVFGVVPAIAQTPPQAPSAQCQHGHGNRGDRGDRANRPAPVAATAQGNITSYHRGPRGHVRGFELNNGTRVMMRGPGGDAMAERVQPGTAVRVAGFTRPDAPNVIRRATVTLPNGTVVAAPQPRGEHQGRGRRGNGRVAPGR